jgi:hypothetical protein
MEFDGYDIKPCAFPRFVVTVKSVAPTAVDDTGVKLSKITFRSLQRCDTVMKTKEICGGMGGKQTVTTEIRQRNWRWIRNICELALKIFRKRGMVIELGTIKTHLPVDMTSSEIKTALDAARQATQ